MKELNIIEAMEMPVGTEFKVVYQDGKENDITVKLSKFEYADGNKLIWSDGEEIYLSSNFILATLIPIQQPVSFIDAINSRKRIKCVHERFASKKEYMSISDMFYKFTLGAEDFPIVLINEGKWYIEE
jgi:hypothetical protein